uniref:Uncharacterized protein n=1 Tax=viral metagenome TaxID=1070528 RepID=A0A6C0BTN4_9ZZZZ
MNEDHDIEQFWLSFKQSMLNFYGITEHNILKRPIEKWSDSLNSLQREKRYTDIEESIKHYISLYAMDLIRCCNHYHMRILNTNINRWNKVAANNKCLQEDDEKTYFNCVFMLIDICLSMLENGNKDAKDLFSQYELYILNHDYSILINYAVAHKKIGMLDKLLKYDYYGTLQVLGIEESDKNTKYSAKKLLYML